MAMQGYLVDTSIWIEHLKKPHELLVQLLNKKIAYTHASVIGELACGSLSKREQFLNDIKLLPKAIEATPAEVLIFIEKHRTYSRGLGLIDMQILASTFISSLKLLTNDKKLQAEYLIQAKLS